MEISLSHFDGTNISNFKDRSGKECSFQDFLRSNGLYSSQFYLYIKTKKKIDEQTTDIDGNVENIVSKSETENNRETLGKPETELENIQDTDTHKNKTCNLLVNKNILEMILVKYTRDTISSYCGDVSSLSCYSVSECETFSGTPLQDKDYTPFEHGFTVTSITVGDRHYLYKDAEGHYKFPQRKVHHSTDFILHGPAEICGIEKDRSIIIGVITKIHNEGTCMFTWFKNGQIFVAGIDLCLVRVTEEGEYDVTVGYKDTV